MTGMKRKKYRFKFTDYKLSIKGIAAVVLDVVAVILMLTAIAASVSASGQGTEYVGSRGILAWIFAIAGLVVGILGMQEHKTFKALPKAGMIAGLVMTIIYGVLFVGGLA